MNVIRHYNVTVNDYAIIKIIHLFYVFICNYSVIRQFHIIRVDEDIDPYGLAGTLTPTGLRVISGVYPFSL